MNSALQLHNGVIYGQKAGIENNDAETSGKARADRYRLGQALCPTERSKAVKRHAAVLAQLKDLRLRFAEVHERSMECLDRRALSEFDQLLRAERALIEEQAQLIKKLQNLAQALTPVDDKRRNDNASTSFGHGAAISAGTRLRIAHLQPSVTTSDSDRGGTQKAQLKGGQTHSAS